MLFRSAKGIPAWRVNLIPTMLILTGLLEGVGLLGIASSLASWRLEVSMTFISYWGAGLALINALVWQRYIDYAKPQGIPLLARKELHRITPMLRLMGHFAPLILFALAAAVSYSMLAIAGAFAVSGGVLWKLTVIMRAGYQQGFEIGRAHV